MEYKKFEDLMFLVKSYIHDEKAINLITKAYDRANELHNGQFRKSGEPYIIHPLNVACILAELHVGPDTICAGLLHDVIEDCGITREQVEEEFGPEVGKLVYGVSKLGRINFSTENEYCAKTGEWRMCHLGKNSDILYMDKEQTRSHTLHDRRIFEKRDSTDGKRNSF